jgi:hypothetical protein
VRRSLTGALASLSPFRRQASSTAATGAAPRSALPASPREMATQRPWSAQTAVQDMGTLSDTRVKRWFKKSASEQYKYAKSLSPQQRDELEAELAQTMRGDTPEAGKAFTMWLSVQQARLRTHAPEQRDKYRSGQLKKMMAALTVVGTPAAAILLAESRGRYYRSEARPEYAKALKNFAEVIGDPSLSHEIRQAAVARLEYHAYREGTLTPMDTARLQLFGVQSIAPGAAAATLATARPPAAGGLGPNDVYIGSVEEDLAAQRDPLGEQINKWMAAAGQPPLDNAGAFDHEEGATAFARVLNRRMDSAMGQPGAEKAKVLQDGVNIIRAVAQDRPEAAQADGEEDDVDLQPIRPRVFSMATATLGSCVDNVSEGFSNMVAMVANHQMACDVKAGRIDQPALAAWAGQQFRLDALEKEVHLFLKQATAANHQEISSVRDQLRALMSTTPPMTDVINTILKPDATVEDFQHAQSHVRTSRRQADELLARADISPEGKQSISNAIPLLNRAIGLLSQRKLLLHEPVETMLHAKVKLRDALELPETTSSTMKFTGVSMLDENSLRAIAQQVRAREADPNEMNAYLLSNTTWRAGMKQFHPDRFKELKAQFDDDPFWEMMSADVIDPDVPDDVAIANVEKAAEDLQKRMKTAEDNLLLECAGPRAPGDAKAAVLGNLTAVRARFAALHTGNWQTAIDDETHDAAILPALVMSENARRPDLNLHLVSPTDGFAVANKVNQLPFLTRQRVMFSLPPENRHITADVRRSRGKTSIIAIDPLSPERGGYKDHWQANYLPFLKSQFGEDVTVTVLTLDTQISGSDSRIYGLSHASKMADNVAMFDALHRQNVSGAPLKTSLGGEAKQYLADGNIRLVDGTSVLPADFVKHAQSEQTIDAWMRANPSAYANASVNKAGQTLKERHDANATTRFQSPQQVHHARMQGKNPAVNSTKMSTSIERKRLAYIDRAMAYFSQAPAEVGAQALTSMQSIDRASSDMRKPLAAWRRNWGPSPGVPVPAGDAGAT